MAEVRVILVEPERGINVGHLARAMKNFGFKELYLVKPKANLEEASIFSAHGRDVLKKAKIVGSLQEAIEGTEISVATTAKPAKSTRNVLRFAVDPKRLAIELRSINGKVALIFGRESRGLSNEELNLCDVILSIPASESYPTMNVSHAAAIIFYELHQGKFAGKGKYELRREHVARLMDVFHEILLKIGLPKHRLTLAQRAFHNVVSRGAIAAREATLLLGVLRKILRKLEQSF
ncbi:TPA: RNA methyltransferase [Candidatus Bathyarchaeota archaeon]|nr:RNA methyltransferase [Candidatus Bathyarchaeota archaeon]